MIGRTSAFKEQPCFVSRQEKKHWCAVNEKGMDGNMETWWKERSTEKRFKVDSIRDKCRIWLLQIGLSISVIISRPRLPLPLLLFPCSRSITATKIVLDDSMRWQLDYGNTILRKDPQADCRNLTVEMTITPIRHNIMTTHNGHTQQSDHADPYPPSKALTMGT